ncbi:MAG: hypothetical protein IPK26_07315 [Planctomycetes bacterium]|nr:hypothetical protein [Planctomycetota bacterium]
MRWLPNRAPDLTYTGGYCYDSVRDRLLLFDRESTFEGVMLNGQRSYSYVAAASPSLAGWLTGAAFARDRARVVCYDRARTWEWDGAAWLLRANFPPISSFLHLVGHESRGTVIAFGGASPSLGNDLYEWNGSNWTLIPTTGRPPRPVLPDTQSYYYLTMAYDARRDKVVLFGRATDRGDGFLYDFHPDLWEWDTAGGWVSRTAQWPFQALPNVMLFDSRRGTLIATEGVAAHAEWDGGPAWQPLVLTNPIPPALGVMRHAAYDAGLGVTMACVFNPAGPWIEGWKLGTVSQAEFDRAGDGCAGSLGEPALGLTRDWTRAWVGGTLSTEVTNLPYSGGFLVVGWSNTTAGAVLLPLVLTPYGMPGCHLRISLDSVYPLAGSAQRARQELPVPNLAALVGCVLYQQAFATDPAANAAGLTASNAVRITVGHR